MEKPSFSWSLEETRAYRTAWRLATSPLTPGAAGFGFMATPHGSVFVHPHGLEVWVGAAQGYQRVGASSSRICSECQASGGSRFGLLLVRPRLVLLPTVFA